MSVVLITHDLGVVTEYCDRVAVMYAGQVVESGPTRTVIERPLHPYTQGLLGSIPRLSRLEEKIRPIEGTVPELIDLPPQCRFRDRRSEEHTSELQSLMRTSYAVFCLKNKKVPLIKT